VPPDVIKEIVDARLSLGLVSLEDKDVRRVPQSDGFWYF